MLIGFLLLLTIALQIDSLTWTGGDEGLDPPAAYCPYIPHTFRRGCEVAAVKFSDGVPANVPTSSWRVGMPLDFRSDDTKRKVMVLLKNVNTGGYLALPRNPSSVSSGVHVAHRAIGVDSGIDAGCLWLLQETYSGPGRLPLSFTLRNALSGAYLRAGINEGVEANSPIYLTLGFAQRADSDWAVDQFENDGKFYARIESVIFPDWHVQVSQKKNHQERVLLSFEHSNASLWTFWRADEEITQEHQTTEDVVNNGKASCDMMAAVAVVVPEALGCGGFEAPIDPSPGLNVQVYRHARANPHSLGWCGADAIAIGDQHGLAFDMDWVVYQRPPDNFSFWDLPPMCDKERRFWGHILTPGSPEPQKMCLYVDCLSPEERKAAETTWANLQNSRLPNGRLVSLAPWVQLTFLTCSHAEGQADLFSQGAVRWIFHAFEQLGSGRPGLGCDWNIFIPSPSYVDIAALWEQLSCYPSNSELWWLSTHKDRAYRKDIPTSTDWPFVHHPRGLHAVSRAGVPVSAFCVRDGVCTMAVGSKPGAEVFFATWKQQCCNENGFHNCFDNSEIAAFCCNALTVGGSTKLPSIVGQTDRRRDQSYLNAQAAFIVAMEQTPQATKIHMGTNFLIGPLGQMADNYVFGGDSSGLDEGMDNDPSVFDIVATWNITRASMSPSAVHVGHEPGCTFQIYPVAPESLYSIHALRNARVGSTSSCSPQAVVDKLQQSDQSFRRLLNCGDWWMALRHGVADWQQNLHPAKCFGLVPLGSQQYLNATGTALRQLLAKTCCRLRREGQAGFFGRRLHQEFWRVCFDQQFTPGRCCMLQDGGRWLDPPAPGAAVTDGTKMSIRRCPASVMLQGLPRSGSTWVAILLSASYDLMQGLRFSRASARRRLKLQWLRLLRTSVRSGGMVKDRFLQLLWMRTFGKVALRPRAKAKRCEKKGVETVIARASSPSRSTFVHEFFVPGQYFRWENIETETHGEKLGKNSYFSSNKTLLRRILLKVSSVMGASFYTGFHNMLREKVPVGTIDELVADAWHLSGFQFTKEVQMHFRAAEFAKHFDIIGLIRHRYFTFPSSANSIFTSLWNSLALNDYVDPFNKAVRDVALTLASSHPPASQFDEVILAHTVTTLFGLRTLKKLRAPVLRWEHLVLLAGSGLGSPTAPPQAKLELQNAVNAVLGPVLGINDGLVLEVLRAMTWPGAWGVGVADKELVEKAADSQSFQRMRHDQWLEKRRNRYFSFPGAGYTEAKVQKLLQYAVEVDPGNADIVNMII